MATKSHEIIERIMKDSPQKDMASGLAYLLGSLSSLFDLHPDPEVEGALRPILDRVADFTEKRPRQT